MHKSQNAPDPYLTMLLSEQKCDYLLIYIFAYCFKDCQLTWCTNPRMHLIHISQCSIQNRNVHISVLKGALWDMEQVHSGICEIGLLSHIIHQVSVIRLKIARHHFTSYKDQVKSSLFYHLKDHRWYKLKMTKTSTVWMTTIKLQTADNYTM